MGQVNYVQLRNGDWGIRADYNIQSGDRVTVIKRNGERKEETVDRIVWSGNGATIASIVQRRRPGGRHGYCDVCDHDIDGCADMDCTCKACGGMMR